MYISIHAKYKSVAPCVFILLHQYRPCIHHVYYCYLYIQLITVELTYTCIYLLFSGFRGTHRPEVPHNDGLEDNDANG